MICHEGKIIDVKDKSVSVKIVSKSACAACHAKSICNAFETQEKIIHAISNESLLVGDTVMIKIEKRMGKIAIFFGFFLPFILMVSVLFISHALGSTEMKAAILALASLFPYYICLYIFRKKIEKDFIFLAEKIQE